MKKSLIVPKLIGLEFLVGATAVYGGFELIQTNGMGMPVMLLRNTIFTSYIIPGLILGLVVGGCNLLAGILLMQKQRYALELSAIAGFSVLIWIFTELYLIEEPQLIQFVYFGFGVLILILTMLLLDSRNEEKNKRR